MTVNPVDLVEILKAEIEKKLKWSDSKDWTTPDFEKLRTLIFEKTSVSLSVSTLKRIWGKIPYNSAPTATTLNALAAYLGHRHWRDFAVQHTSGSVSVIQPRLPADGKKRNIYWMVTLGVIGIALVILLSRNFSIKNEKTLIDKNKIYFTGNVLTNDLPNTVVFSYNTGSPDIDSVMIQQSWDPARREKVAAGEHKHSSIYYYPGVYNAKLVFGNTVVRQTDIIIRTNGWQGMIDREPTPVYLTSEEIKLNGGIMEISPAMLREKTGRSDFNETWTRFYKFGDLPLTGNDSFTVSALVRNTSSREQSACRKIKLSVFSLKGFVAIPFSTQGCTADISLTVDEKNISGKDNDFSAFGCDFSKAQLIKYVAVGKRIEIFLNGQSIYSVTRSNHPGKTVGIGISIEGSGTIADLSFK